MQFAKVPRVSMGRKSAPVLSIWLVFGRILERGHQKWPNSMLFSGECPSANILWHSHRPGFQTTLGGQKIKPQPREENKKRRPQISMLIKTFTRVLRAPGVCLSRQASWSTSRLKFGGVIMFDGAVFHGQGLISSSTYGMMTTCPVHCFWITWKCKHQHRERW